MKETRSRDKKGRSAPRETVLAGCHVDPLLVGADREFLDCFPRKLIQDTGVLPLRRYGGFGLVVVRDDPSVVARLQRDSDIRLIGVPALNAFGIDLFLRYWSSAGTGNGTPPLWVSDSRKGYLRKLGGLLSLRGQVNPAGLLASLIVTSPLNRHCPLMVLKVNGEGQAIYLHGMGGLKVGVRFPGAWHDRVIAHLRHEFRLGGVTSSDGHLVECRGPEDHGLNDVTATVIPPLAGETFLLEPRGHHRS